MVWKYRTVVMCPRLLAVVGWPLRRAHLKSQTVEFDGLSVNRCFE